MREMLLVGIPLCILCCCAKEVEIIPDDDITQIPVRKIPEYRPTSRMTYRYQGKPFQLCEYIHDSKGKLSEVREYGYDESGEPILTSQKNYSGNIDEVSCFEEGWEWTYSLSDSLLMSINGSCIDRDRCNNSYRRTSYILENDLYVEIELKYYSDGFDLDFGTINTYIEYDPDYRIQKRTQYISTRFGVPYTKQFEILYYYKGDTLQKWISDNGYEQIYYYNDDGFVSRIEYPDYCGSNMYNTYYEYDEYGNCVTYWGDHPNFGNFRCEITYEEGYSNSLYLLTGVIGLEFEKYPPFTSLWPQ